ncbi:hypothetical protein EW146_g4567 [Bondarzewia mesenterica]|uniref:Uncharacterized protein n=1 Tax=Bondarzewia mesenterica TaxID=1095465 RepID=A0A4S4LUN9_9AGAM|nr:hypothetical protein EW146_g4567 [Bondarzewia mesenterica]
MARSRIHLYFLSRTATCYLRLSHPLAIQTPPSSPRGFYQAYVEDAPDDGLEPAQPRACRIQHPMLDGVPVDEQGNDLPPGAPPAPYADNTDAVNWAPFGNHAQFELADFLFRQNQMPATNIDTLLNLWAASQHEGEEPPFMSHTDVYSHIDSIHHGDIPWESFSIQYSGGLPDSEIPTWMRSEYHVWFRNPRMLIRNQLGNLDYADEIDYAPAQVFDADGQRYQLQLARTSITLCTYRTATSTTTFDAHIGMGSVSPVSYPYQKTDRAFADDAVFCSFHRQLYHLSLTQILEPLRPGMTTSEVIWCPDGHLRWVIYGLGPYIADYPEQVMLACIVSGWCPRCTAHRDNLDGGGISRSHGLTRLLMDAYDDKELWDNHGIIPDVMPFTARFPQADIHELISFDILHQVIKGTFKDHLIAWVEQYLKIVHPAGVAIAIMADIDRRIAAALAFPGLRRFPDGRGFKQWIGDDSKALMKVYLSAIIGHVPPAMVCAIASFMDFCYLVRRSTINESTLTQIEDALHRFHADRAIFEETGVHPTGFSLPRQHTLVHYRHLVQDFAACRVDFEARGMLAGPCLSQSVQAAIVAERAIADANCNGTGAGPTHLIAQANALNVDAADGPHVQATVTLARKRARGYPRRVGMLAEYLEIPNLQQLIQRFFYDQLNPGAVIAGSEANIDECPRFDASSKISVFHSVQALFYSPSDLCGHGEGSRNDCIFAEKDAELPGMQGLHVAQVLLLFSFTYRQISYPCAIVKWFVPAADEPCDQTGIWLQKPDLDLDGQRVISVIHLDSVMRAAHLIGVYGAERLPYDFHFTYSLFAFNTYYVNKFADHNAHEIAF